MSRKVRYTNGGTLKRLIDAVETVHGPIGFKVVGAMETVLHAAFEDTQAITHVITASLKGSGKTESDFDGDNWTGSITYGGSSPGFKNDPVTYAIYEMARGGDHDFFRNLQLYDRQFEDAIDRHFDAL